MEPPSGLCSVILLVQQAQGAYDLDITGLGQWLQRAPTDIHAGVGVSSESDAEALLICCARFQCDLPDFLWQQLRRRLMFP
ncbi:hypothetical protein ADK47_10580 [Streptomyces rimosus subsp. rimosus]|nr:hypothetical protein DF17_17530 [Streptomyces rimosus]KOG77280.1 hypothetical protein ADK78_09365 [Kitasatospora aureofaciens]KOT35119.1 hypothetical protein ADK42_20965 [Streptomyces rimosus subsp. rimosus]KOT45343.1 hypothetical protein ADK84_05200 [Streptomyces sp. NRRL WC-3701]KEF17941.1 hypothetical protein DF18_26580 [Streptomyces rimosus]